MRIIAGTNRGRRLAPPPDNRARPTADRVRGAIFNSLFSLGDPIAGARVLDLFAGTGAMGLEALSRGAVSATFVESDRRMREVLRANISVLDQERLSTVIADDALHWLDHAASEMVASPIADVAFADPPYDFCRWDELLSYPLARLVVVESDRPVTETHPPGPQWGLATRRRYGATVVEIIRLVME